MCHRRVTEDGQALRRHADGGTGAVGEVHATVDPSTGRLEASGSNGKPNGFISGVFNCFHMDNQLVF